MQADELNDCLLECFSWRLVLPQRASKCGEWDSRIFLAANGERFEMPNISRRLVQNAVTSGDWDSSTAIVDLFSEMSEPVAGPGLV